MIKVENVVGPSVNQMYAIVCGMRNPMNSWDRFDSEEVLCAEEFGCSDDCEMGECCHRFCDGSFFRIGPNDRKLAEKLEKAGPEHRKHLRMMYLYADISAPLFWWKQFDTYKIGTVAESCSTMHKIHAKPFELSDFDTEGMSEVGLTELSHHTIPMLNNLRDLYLVDKDKSFWQDMVNLLPENYVQKRTVCVSYETVARMIEQRKNHKLGNWREFVDICKMIPYYDWAIKPVVEKG